MSDQPRVKEFPDIIDKLKAAPKKSAFERQKAEAEAKRRREEEENAAVLREFKDFLDDDISTLSTSKSRDAGPQGLGGLRGGAQLGSGPRRHFAPSASSMKSGPGSLGPDPAFSRKRGPDGYPKPQGRDQGILAFENSSTGPNNVDAAFQDLDDERDAVEDARAVDKAAPKPTVHLSSLPPGTRHDDVRALMPPNLTIDGDIKFPPPSAPSLQERKSTSAIVTLSPDTPAMDIDTVVAQLQNRYLGRGYYLSISRHLSSATLGGSLGASSAMFSTAKLPFSAQPIQPSSYGSLSRAPPPGAVRGFAPPSELLSAGPGQSNVAGSVQVNVTLPSRIEELRLIHKTIENLIQWGPDFEALLMSCREVQRDEKWAWLWDSRSPGGVYYRWKLWEVLTGTDAEKINSPYTQLFDEGAPWHAPNCRLPFEYVISFDQLASASDYDSSEEEDSDDERIASRHRDHLGGEAGDIAPDGEGKEYLNPLEKAKLVHLLARLPTSTARLRRGDVARISHFAISRSSTGVPEIIDLLVSNIETPFAFTSANVNHNTESSDEDSDSDGKAARTREKEKEKEDPSSAKLVALYVITDLLNSCANAGVRGAWRYRNAFAPVLEKRQIFEKLGRLEKELQWGRIRTDKWKRAIAAVFHAWETNSVFDSDRLQHFKALFEKPPLTMEEKEELEKKDIEEQMKTKAKSKWKSVEEKLDEKEQAGESRLGAQAMDVDGPSGPNTNNEQMELDNMEDGNVGENNVDGEPMTGEEIAGLDIEEDELVGFLTEEETAELELYKQSALAEDEKEQLKGSRDQLQATEPNDHVDAGGETAAARARRNRPKAVDMFAESDEE